MPTNFSHSVRGKSGLPPYRKYLMGSRLKEEPEVPQQQNTQSTPTLTQGKPETKKTEEKKPAAETKKYPAPHSGTTDKDYKKKQDLMEARTSKSNGAPKAPTKKPEQKPAKTDTKKQIREIVSNNTSSKQGSATLDGKKQYNSGETKDTRGLISKAFDSMKKRANAVANTVKNTASEAASKAQTSKSSGSSRDRIMSSMGNTAQRSAVIDDNKKKNRR